MPEPKKEIIYWKNDDVIHWLKKELFLEAYQSDFVSHEIDGRDLIDLSDDNLKYDLNVIKLHDRKTIQRSICTYLRNLNLMLNDGVAIEPIQTPQKQNKKVDITNPFVDVRNEDSSQLYKFNIYPGMKIKDLIKECTSIFACTDSK